MNNADMVIRHKIIIKAGTFRNMFKRNGVNKTFYLNWNQSYQVLKYIYDAPKIDSIWIFNLNLDFSIKITMGDLIND